MFLVEFRGEYLQQTRFNRIRFVMKRFCFDTGESVSRCRFIWRWIRFVLILLTFWLSGLNQSYVQRLEIAWCLTSFQPSYLNFLYYALGNELFPILYSATHTNIRLIELTIYVIQTQGAGTHFFFVCYLLYCNCFRLRHSVNYRDSNVSLLFFD